MQQVEERVVYTVLRQSWLDRLARQLQRTVNRLFLGSAIGLRIRDFLNGSWLAHPLHPAVTDVPVGAWTTALVLDGVEAAAGHRMDRATSTAIGVGIASAVASAATGIADWSETRNDQRRVGLVHALANTLALTLYGASLWRRASGDRASGKALSTAGYLAMLTGAYLGGELVFRLGTQVNRNAWTPQIREFIRVMADAELPPETPTRVNAQGIPVVLVRHQEKIYALNEICSHAGGPLSEGHLEDGNIVCPWHGSTYRLEDGTVVHGPSAFAQPSYEVRVRDGQIEVCPALP